LRKTREILRLLWHLRLGVRQTARSCQTGHATVVEYRQRAEEAGLDWVQVKAMDEVSLERQLFPPPATAATRPLPEWSEIHLELKKPGVTLQLLWDEYKAAHPEDGYQYSRFCQLYRQWRGRLDLSMRQQHKAGEKLFVDYCGQTVPITDPSTGETREAQIFVAVLGASNYTYAEATRSQQLPDWIGSHVRTFEFLEGVTGLLIPDNLKSGVEKPCRYEPDLNRTYQDLATHYSTAVIPARVRKPKDKAKVEVGVQIVERWILACLRHRQFFSLNELNEAIRELLERLNNRPFRKLPGSRRSQFEALDRPALKPLPSASFEYADWAKARVGPDYHVEVDGHFYSVPYQLVRQELEVRFTVQTVEFLYRGQRVACHVRSYIRGQCTTSPEHQPAQHRHHAEWTPQKLVKWAHETGPATAEVVAEILISRPHPQQGFHSCLGLRKLARHYGPDRLEAACRRALAIRGLSYKSLCSILKNGLDRQALPAVAEPTPALEHDNVRGAAYYRSQHDTETVPC
jgi:transposase